MMTVSFPTKLAIVAMAALAISACTPRRPVETASGGQVPTMPPSTGPGPSYPTAPGGVVGGNQLGAAMPGSEQDFVVNVGDRVYFDLDSYEVRPDAYARLDAQAAWLMRYPQVVIRIEGNADERGTREYNLALGARRAESVRTYLIQRGVQPARIDTISFGKERPIAAGAGEETWARNRNAHTAIAGGAPR